MYRIIVGALCALVLSPTFGQSTVNRETPGDASYSLPDAINPVRIRKYRNTEWQKIRNTFLYWIAPDVLAAIWPYRGYNVKNVRSLACGNTNLSLGKSLTFVNKEYDVGDPTAFGGVEFDYTRFPGEKLHLQNLCNLLAKTKDDLSAANFRSAFLRYRALNPPPDGSWKILDDEDINDLFSGARPLFRGKKVENYQLNVLPYNAWITAETAKIMQWSEIRIVDEEQKWSDEVVTKYQNWFDDATEDKAIRNRDSGRLRVWKYNRSGLDESWPFFLTYYSSDASGGADSTKWRTPGSVFDWESSPALPPLVDSIEDEQHLLLWATSSATQFSEEEWYLVTDLILSDAPDARFEKSIARGHRTTYNFGARPPPEATKIQIQ